MRLRHRPCKEDVRLDQTVADRHAVCAAHKGGGVVGVCVQDAVNGQVVDVRALYVGEEGVVRIVVHRDIDRDLVAVSVEVSAERADARVVSDIL